MSEGDNGGDGDIADLAGEDVNLAAEVESGSETEIEDEKPNLGVQVRGAGSAIEPSSAWMAAVAEESGEEESKEGGGKEAAMLKKWEWILLLSMT
jgi:hypothetical protein